MRTAATETQEEKIRHNGNENVHSFPIGRTATATATEPVALLDMSLSLADEQPIKEASHPEYRMWEHNNRKGVSTGLIRYMIGATDCSSNSYRRPPWRGAKGDT